MTFQVEHQEKICRIAEKAATELFNGMGISMHPTQQEKLEGGTSALITLEGDCLSGTMGMEVCANLLEKLPSLAGVTPRHWAKELTNQLAGRIRIKLLQDGIILDMGIPSSLRNSHIELAVDVIGCCEVFLKNNTGQIRLFFDFEPLAAPNFEKNTVNEHLSEGSALFF